MQHACYLKNRLPHAALEGYMTPYEKWYKNKPNLSHIKVWGCKAYVRDPRGNIRKDWSDRSKVGFLIGYSRTPIGWIIYIPALGSCVTSIHVKFNEDIPEYRIEYFKELEGEMLREMQARSGGG